jgi:beta-galactosidase
MGFDQVVLHREEKKLPAPKAGKVAISQDHRYITVKGENFRYRFDIRLGAFDELIFDQHSLITAPMALNIWRAPTDNDRNIRETWQKAGYHRAVQRAYEAEGAVRDGVAVINCSLSLTPVYLQPIIRVKAAYVIGADGAIDCSFDCEKDADMPDLPRFGLRLQLPKDMRKAQYFGFGPYESYVDKRRASHMGWFETTAEENHEDYLKPQENGSHWGCEEAQVSGSQGIALKVESEAAFSFQISPYTQEELTQKAHSFELTKAPGPVVCLDYKLNGIGSNSCGPKLLEKYAFAETSFSFRLRIAPKKEEN